MNYDIILDIFIECLNNFDLKFKKILLKTKLFY
jgi:hypothetical protein